MGWVEMFDTLSRPLKEEYKGRLFVDDANRWFAAYWQLSSHEAANLHEFFPSRRRRAA